MARVLASSVTQAATSNNRSRGIGDLGGGSIRVASIGQGGGQDLASSVTQAATRLSNSS